MQHKSTNTNHKAAIDPLGIRGLIVVNLIAALCTTVAVATANTFNLAGWHRGLVIVAIDFALSLSVLLLYARRIAKRADPSR